ncbi:MAG: cell surface protein SprA [Melioribacteraceae bacterium]|nr:cell surface protein SprA [Melioribacteraceae bacterium]
MRIIDRSTIFSAPKNTSKPGIKLFLLPFFVAVIIFSFGFTIYENPGFNREALFNACLINLMTQFNNENRIELKQTVIPQNSFKQTEYFNSVFTNPDSTVKKDSIAIQDSIAKDTITVHDTIAVKLTRSDSIKLIAKQDSLRRVDSLSQDSTARIKHFTYVRKDNYTTEFRPKRISSLLLKPSVATLTRIVQLDSSGTKVIIKESIGGQITRPILEIPLEEYIKLRMEAISRKLWEEKGYEYKLKEDKRDLSQLITDITNIEIPLPSTSFLSIFGPPRINLKIAGAVDIHGAWRNETTTGITTSALGNTRNEPDFKQQVQINLSGTIGDKLTISADWNTERQFQYENQLKLKYTGYEDEIIQTIEAGNVSLQTSPLIGGSEALFGVKALMKMGPFSLTALASQKKGEVQEVSISGGAKSQKFEIRAYDYSPNHFFIHEVYTDPRLNIFNNYYGQPLPRIVDSLRVKDIQVWKTITGLVNPNERKGNAYIDLRKRGRNQLYNDLRDSTAQSIPGKREIDRRFILLQLGVDYEIHEETGYISFKTTIQDQDAIAAAFRLEGPTSSPDDDVYYGEFLTDVGRDSTARIVLRLIKPPNLQPQFKEAWKLQLRNIYPIGGRDIKEEGFLFDIKFQIEGSEPQNEVNGSKLLQVFGLDKTDKSGTAAQPDGIFDYFPNRTVFPNTGEIVFPLLQPFGDDFPTQLDQSLKYDAIYDTTVTFAKQERTKDKFIFAGEYSAAVSSVYSLGFNVVENSVKVLLGGNQLKEGVDYTVDYNLGQIIIRKDEALVPGADLRVTFEQNDLFQLASKTLLGLRGLLEINKETTLGFSYLNLNQQTLSDKVRIGEEPLNNTIFGIDFNTRIDLPFVTKALDQVISTSTPSSFTLTAEYAHMSPDPNTKKSTITSDGGRSIAYVDDFEGAKRIIPLGMAYGSWRDISVPTSLPFISNLPLFNNPINPQPQNAQMNYKAKTYWFNVTPSDVTVKQIYGNRKEATPEDNLVSVLDFKFLPNEKGAYNWYPDLSDKRKNWGGMMKVLSSTANNLIEENIEFIEFWVQVVKAPPDFKLNIDVGQISEDVIPNGRLDSEDKNQNDLVDDGEDTGIDGWVDSEEPGYNSATNTDPSNDNYSFQLTANADYSRINGTEKNAQSLDLGRLPDSEDLNRNFTLDLVNSYFRYEIPMDTNRVNNQFVQGGGNNRWYLFKVPLKDFVYKEGSPSFSVVEFIRFWVSGTEQDVHLRFAEMNLVGNQWQKVLNSKVTVDDEVLTVSTISYEENPEYESPPGVFRERDRTKPDYQIYKNEQSLDLILKNLGDSERREVVRYLYRPLDVFNYKEMKLFIHGEKDSLNPGSVSYYKGAENYSSEVYMRFGSDTLNFYEYRQPVRGGWNEVSLVFAELTAIKQRRDSTNLKTLYRLAVEGKDGHSYGVFGNPTLTRITFFTIGIVNPNNKGTPGSTVSGSVWINELRVLEADDTPGWAYSTSSSLTLADLAKVNFNINQTNPFFHRLADRFGSRQDNLNWGVTADLDVLKLLPVNLPGSNLRINYTRQEQSTNPIFLPGTDIKVEEAQNELRKSLIDQNIDQQEIDQAVENLKSETQSISVSETWTLSNIRIKIPTDAWYINDLFNNLSFGFNYNKTAGRSPTIESNTSWIWNANANYSVALSRDLFFKPLDIPLIGDLLGIFTDYKDVKIYFAPQSINASLTASRRRSFTQNRLFATKPNITRDFTSSRGAGFSWTFTEGGFLNLALTYNFDVSSTLAYLLANDDLEKSESEIWREIFSGAFFGKDYNFKQNFDLRANPKLPSIWDLNRYISLNASYGVSYNWQNNFQQEELGRSAGYSNRINTGLTIRLKSIFAPIFQEAAPVPQTQQPREGGRGGRRSQVQRTGIELERPSDEKRDVAAISDSVAISDSAAIKDTNKILSEDVEEEDDSPGTLAVGLEFLKLGVKWIFFDYDQISINFSQNSSFTGGGLAGEGTGFNNFWGVKQVTSKGPSRLFMLGLSNNIGERAPLGNLSDAYTHKNDLDLKTSRPLWEGAQLDLTWKVGWGLNKNTTLQTDSVGFVSVNNLVSTGTIDRSFLSLPPVFFLSFLDNGIKKVSELYDKGSLNPSASLSDAFVKGFETFSVFSKIPILSKLAKYIPRPNWNFNWTGLEKYPLLSFAKRVSIQHTYSSSYSEGWKINPDGLQEVQSQRIDYGFQPLIGMNIQFDQLLGGIFQSTIRYSAKSSFSLGVSTRNITESFNRDINISASYSKSGFELPLFGISLKNDLEISFSYTSGKTSSLIYEMDDFKEEGKPQEGKTNTTIEPKIKYVMSSRVTLSIFYRRTSIEPEGASRIPPTVTNEAGIDVHIAIQ